MFQSAPPLPNVEVRPLASFVSFPWSLSIEKADLCRPFFSASPVPRSNSLLPPLRSVSIRRPRYLWNSSSLVRARLLVARDDSYSETWRDCSSMDLHSWIHGRFVSSLLLSSASSFELRSSPPPLFPHPHPRFPPLQLLLPLPLPLTHYPSELSSRLPSAIRVLSSPTVRQGITTPTPSTTNCHLLPPPRDGSFLLGGGSGDGTEVKDTFGTRGFGLGI